MDIQLHNSSAKLSVSDAVFGVEYNEPLIHQVVTAYLAGGRAGTKAQKSKAMVSGGGKKPWKQKGTGRARAGSIRSLLWRGGGKTFAAVPRDFSQKVNRKMYRGAMRSVLSELLRQERVVVADELSVSAPKTKELKGKLDKLGFATGLIIVEGFDANLWLAARNLPDVVVEEARFVDPVALVGAEKVVASAAALKIIEERLK